LYKKLFGWLLILVITISMVGCGSSKSTDNATSAAPARDAVSLTYSEPINGDEELADKSDASIAGSSPASSKTSSNASGEVKSNSTQKEGLVNNVNVSQKLIFTGQVNFETLNFEKTRTNLCDYISSIGGYQQNSSIKGGGIGYEGVKSAEYVFRIPKTNYIQAFTDLRKFGTVVFEQSSGEDVTDQYFDTEARLKSLKIQYERLEALLQKAVKMEDILKIEKELQTTLYDIENYTGTLKKWDSLVEYSTLKVNINEVEQIKPTIPKEKDGFFSRIAFGFKNSVIELWEFLQNFIVFVAAALPVIIPLGLICYLLYRLVRKKIKKFSNK
jgi:hypothetical protein